MSRATLSRTRRAIAVALVFCNPVLLSAQGRRGGHTLTFDAAGKRALLVDGHAFADPNAVDTVWAWNGAAWSEVASKGPGPRTLGGVAFDANRGLLVIYGGLGIVNGSRYGDTWEWDGKSWSERRVPGPGPRDHHAMVYDPSRKRIVMFGGVVRDGSQAWATETWEWDGSTWHKLAVPGPGGRVHHAIAYDAARNLVLLFGGIAQDNRYLGDLWAWDGSVWRLLANDGPSARARHRMAFDEGAGTLVLYGGTKPGAAGESDETLDDMWLWDGKVWTKRDAKGPGKRRLHAMTYDSVSKRVLLYGGSQGTGYEADLWQWDGAAWRKLS
jgi:hypothetical protein